MERFPTIQGEGFHQGKASYFVRLGGCDVGCSWCDVKDSWPMDAHPMLSIDEITDEASLYKSRMAVITGGEPLMHDLAELTNQLKVKGFGVHIETSGAHPISGEYDWITLSPKKFKEALPEFFELADELKIIVVNKSDFDWAENMAQKMKKKGHKLFLQPEWDRSEKMTPLIVDYIKDNPQWEMSLQIHKFMNIP